MAYVRRKHISLMNVILVSYFSSLQSYPQDGIAGAVEGMLGFDAMNPNLRDLVAEAFRKFGFHVPPIARSRASDGSDGSSGAGGGGSGGSGTQPIRITGGNSRQSKPKTGLGNPKHGKIDPKNDPHVGGNTWAGGSGGSDTAGLGGRGGPYRLDSGHAVHQVSDEDKAAVSEESRRRAAQMAAEGLANRLKEINMGQTDYAKYRYFEDRVRVQVAQLKENLAELTRRVQYSTPLYSTAQHCCTVAIS